MAAPRLTIALSALMWLYSLCLHNAINIQWFNVIARLTNKTFTCRLLKHLHSGYPGCSFWAIVVKMMSQVQYYTELLNYLTRKILALPDGSCTRLQDCRPTTSKILHCTCLILMLGFPEKLTISEIPIFVLWGLMFNLVHL